MRTANEIALEAQVEELKKQLKECEDFEREITVSFTHKSFLEA